MVVVEQALHNLKIALVQIEELEFIDDKTASDLFNHVLNEAGFTHEQFTDLFS